jgi:DNA repair protein RadD
MVKRDDTELRGYQRNLIDQTLEALRDHRSVLLQAPTGAGKTEMAVEIARKHSDRGVWFVVHRRELIDQTSRALKRAGMDEHGVVAPRHREEPTIRIQVCSIDALRHRFKRYPPPGVLIIDECHHVAAPSWAKLVDRFPEAKLLGLTATPERLDARGLEKWFEHLIVGPDTRTLIDAGYLSKFKYFAPNIPDLRGVRVKQREYDRHDLEEAMNKSTLVGDIVDHFKEKLAPNARALAFCVSVDASRELAARFTKAGIPAKHVDWETPQEKRDKAVADLDSGKLRVLANVEVFTEGFDLPAIDAVLLLRPTKSFALFRQMVGRCLRVAKGKTCTTILDHAGLVYDHKFPDDDVEWSLSGRRSNVAETHKKYSIHGIIRRCPECSTVHKWSAKCPECGRVYETKDRTIEEVYGELREIAQGVEYESQKRFARRRGLSASTIANYVKQKGLVTYGPRRLIKIKEGLARVEWLRENKYIRQNPQSTPGFDTKNGFARRVGVNRETIPKWIKKGLPTTGEPNLIPVEDGVEWVRRNTKDGRYQHPEFDSQIRFAQRIGIHRGTIRNWIKKGLPLNESNLIPVEAALRWVKENRPATQDAKRAALAKNEGQS